MSDKPEASDTPKLFLPSPVQPWPDDRVGRSYDPVHPERLGPYYDPANLDPGELDDLRKIVGFVPAEIFRLIQSWVIWPTADFIPTRLVEGVKYFLASRRKEPPWQGEFFLQGGRIRPGENSLAAVKRNIKRELSIEGLPDMRFSYLGDFSVLNPETQNGGAPWYSHWHLYEVDLNGLEIGTGDGTITDHKWFSEIPSDFPEEYKVALRAAGFKDVA